MSYEEVVDASGLDARTIRGMIHGEKQPHAKTVRRLAEALGASTEELFLAPSGMTAEAFDAATNPLVEQLIAAKPELFEGWVPEDYAELSSRFGVGGAMTAEGVLSEAESLNRKHKLINRARVVLESRDARLLETLIDLLYDRVTSID